MEIKYQGHTQRTRESREFWGRVVTDNNNGISVPKIAKRYTNPKTGKPYTRGHIYYILKQMQSSLKGTFKN